METIMKLPFLLALSAAIITGLVGISNGASTNQTCIRMIIAMISFFLVGTLVSKTIGGIADEQEKIRLEAEKKEREEAIRLQQELDEKKKKEAHLGNSLDLLAEESEDDGFSPLDLSQAIRSKVNE